MDLECILFFVSRLNRNSCIENLVCAFWYAPLRKTAEASSHSILAFLGFYPKTKTKYPFPCSWTSTVCPAVNWSYSSGCRYPDLKHSYSFLPPLTQIGFLLFYTRSWVSKHLYVSQQSCLKFLILMNLMSALHKSIFFFHEFSMKAFCPSFYTVIIGKWRKRFENAPCHLSQKYCISATY